MKSRSSITAVLCAALWASPAAWAQAPAGAPPADDVQRLADAIDRHIARRWSEEEVLCTQQADDAEFLRRVHLDLAGKIPAVAEVRAFLDDPSADKRRAVVDRLLNSPGYVTHFTHQWRSMLMPEAATDVQVQYMVPSFEAWLRQELTSGTPYNVMVRELLTVPITEQGRNNLYGGTGEATPLAFYQAKQLMPENLAASTSRMFLGMRIECAQCHDHPFDSWTRENFWGYAAFFVSLQRERGDGLLAAIRELLNQREVIVPDTGQVVPAAFLDGQQPQWQVDDTPRGRLADWMTAPDNPFFARAAANRLWSMLFGTGLVMPVDDFSSHNPPSHPELLDELAGALVAHDYDLKFLLRAIAASRTYQLSSFQTHPSQQDPRLFARMAVRGLSAQQLHASLTQATGGFEPYGNRNPFTFGSQDARGELLETFSNATDAPTERQTSILQSLLLMNGRLVADATQLETSRMLAGVADFPLFDTKARIETLYLASLGRLPRPDELEHLVAFVDGGGANQDPRRALGDVFWALLNSSEFLFNH